MLTLGSQLKYDGVLTTNNPPKPIKITLTEGEIATAESTEGANDPTDMPMADAAIDSSVSILRKLMNLPGPEFNPHSLYLMII